MAATTRVNYNMETEFSLDCRDVDSLLEEWDSRWLRYKPSYPEHASWRHPDYYDNAAERLQQRPLATSALAAAPAGPAGAARPVDLQSPATNAFAAVSATAHPTDGDDRRLRDGESRSQHPISFLSSRKGRPMQGPGPDPP
ncbi:hypothetical protein DL771_004996 [Monosporascus sp. 5C6A]|nr:hypothetical protein DL771_004996 [Monosporascus sp. 5C6A]